VCDHVLIDVCTSELRRLQVPATDAGANPLDGLVAELQRRAHVLVDSTAEVLAYAKRLLSSKRLLNFPTALDELRKIWTSMTLRNPTLFVACDPALVE
jgi:hypothetical protein